MPPISNDRRKAKRWRGKAGLFLLSIGLAALVSGCPGPSFTFAEVEGVITKDGQPLHGIGVYFKPDVGTRGPQSMGVTDDAGRYHLRTYKGDVGAVIGRHRVCLVETEAKGPSSGRIPPEYGSTATTPLRDVEVKPGTQTLNFDLK